MTNQDLIQYGGIVVVAAVVVLYIINWKKEKKTVSEPLAQNNTLNLRLQAYERLVLLAERIALPNLVTRIPAGDLNVRQMQSVLIDQVKTEFDTIATFKILQLFSPTMKRTVARVCRAAA